MRKSSLDTGEVSGTHRSAVCLAVTIALVVFCIPRKSHAYAWMIRHGYAACATCHTDPSGGGLLTRYGRAQSVLLLSSRYGPQDRELGSYQNFLFGAVPLPEVLDLQGWLREGYIASASGSKVVDKRFLFMRGDLGAHIRLGAFRASGVLGVATKDSRAFTQEAAITNNAGQANLLSREHWVGYSVLEDMLLIRAGRMNLPYGLRNVEHTSWVRSETQTDTNQQQQHGVAVAYTGERLRGEVMGILGNFQVHPDSYRERGYSGYFEYALAPQYTLGVSSLITHSEADVAARKAKYRQAHGVFARFLPMKAVVLMVESDLIVSSLRDENPRIGSATLVQADYELMPGLHAVTTGEILYPGKSDPATPGIWLSMLWFAAAHVDLRFDLIHRIIQGGPSTTSMLFQVQAYL